MTKPRVAFVGSGGAAKGAAHLGVLRAIEELGLHIDIWIGTSAAALIGAYYLQGVSLDEMADWFRPFWRVPGGPSMTRPRLWGSPRDPRRQSLGYLASGLFSADALQGQLARTLPVDDFAGLDTQLLVTATDIDGRGRVVFGPGYRDEVPISDAVAASCCVPLLFRPHRIGDRYLVDGELVRTLSLDLAVQAQADVIIVSDVYRPHIATLGDQSLVHRGALAVGRQVLNIVFSEKQKRGVDLMQQLHPHVHILTASPSLGRFPFLMRGGTDVVLRRSYHTALEMLAKAKRRGTFDVVANVHTIGEA